MRRWVQTALSAVLAGGLVAFGGVVYLSTQSKVAGAALFTVGLFAICSFGLNLFTGKVCYLFRRGPAYCADLAVIWLGNLVGAAAVAAGVGLTRIGPELQSAAAGVCGAKLADTWGSLLILGIFCNLFIYVAVEGYNTLKDPVGRHLALFFGVMVFILSGYEHCVADMFYISMAGAWSPDALGRLAVITAGNAVGGWILPLSRDFLSRT